MSLALVYKSVVDSTCMSNIVCFVAHSSVVEYGMYAQVLRAA